MQINLLTTAEEQLMKVIWQMDSFFTKELMEIHPEPKPHPNTISTYLKILTEKNYLSTEKIGRIFKYTPVVSYRDYQSFILKNLISSHFNGETKDLMKFMIDQNIVSFDDFSHYFHIETSVTPIKEKPKKSTNPLSDFIDEITKPKKKKGKGKKKKK